MNANDPFVQGEIHRAISNTTMFAGIGLHEQHMLADKCTLIDYKADEVVIEQGDVGDRLYMIIKGRVLVSKHIESKGWVRVNILNEGDVFGEIAILRQYPRTARITTLAPCSFLTINASDFLNAFQYFPQQSRDNIQLIVAKRLAQLADLA